MTNPSSQQRRQPEWLERIQSTLTTLIVDRIPHLFDRLLQWLSRRQLILMMICLVWLCVPLIVVRPTIWQQGMVAAVLVGVGRLRLCLEEELTARYTSDIWKHINEGIAEFGKAEGYDFIFGASGNGGIMYADEANDITDRVVTYINLRYNNGVKE